MILSGQLRKQRPEIDNKKRRKWSDVTVYYCAWSRTVFFKDQKRIHQMRKEGQCDWLLAFFFFISYKTLCNYLTKLSLNLYMLKETTWYKFLWYFLVEVETFFVWHFVQTFIIRVWSIIWVEIWSNQTLSDGPWRRLPSSKGNETERDT